MKLPGIICAFLLVSHFGGAQPLFESNFDDGFEDGFISDLYVTKRYAAVSLAACRAPDYYNCRNTVNCIHALYRCDGTVDCPEGDDEQDCQDYPCLEDALKCGDTGACISKRLQCNGCLDCPNGDDERDCPSYHGVQCLGNQYHCPEQDTCIPVSWTCDGVKGQCEGDQDEDCDVKPETLLTLSSDSPNTTVTYTVPSPGPDNTTTRPILVRSWRVAAQPGFYLYTRPLEVALGPVCGPSTVTVLEGGQRAAYLCGDSFPPWRTGSIAAHSTDGAQYQVVLKFFPDFTGAERERTFSLFFWQGKY